MTDSDDFDLISMQIAEPVLGQQVGRGILRAHPRRACEGSGVPCCIHSPSGHHMRTWPMNWRSDTGVMERLCPHGIGHPDPDHMAHVRSLTPEHECLPLYAGLSRNMECPHPHLEWQGVHGCDGCCQAA